MKIIDNKLVINGHLVSELAKEYQTPLMIFDDVVLDEKIKLFKEYFKGQVVYASKAFIAPYIIKKCQEHQLYIDATSLGDLYILKTCGFNMEHVFFHGNNKSLDELQYAINEKVIIVVDNIGELKLLSEIANIQVKTMFRLNPGIDAHTHYFIQTSLLSSKFGESIYDDTIISEVMSIYSHHPFLRLLGFHSHIGSQIIDSAAFLENVKVMLTFTKTMNEQYGLKINMINLGGGFGIKYTNENVDLKELLISLNEGIDKCQKELKLDLGQVFIEPGRSIVGPSAVTVYQMGYLKETYSKKRYLFIDGGMTDNIRPALYDAKYECFNADQVSGGTTLCDVAGKCCESGDIIIKDAIINYQQGGYLVVTNTGAYCYSMSSHYNSTPRLAVIAVCHDKVKMIMKREKLEDLTRNFIKEI